MLQLNYEKFVEALEAIADAIESRKNLTIENGVLNNLKKEVSDESNIYKNTGSHIDDTIAAIRNILVDVIGDIKILEALIKIIDEAQNTNKQLIASNIDYYEYWISRHPIDGGMSGLPVNEFEINSLTSNLVDLTDRELTQMMLFGLTDKEIDQEKLSEYLEYVKYIQYQEYKKKLSELENMLDVLDKTELNLMDKERIKDDIEKDINEYERYLFENKRDIKKYESKMKYKGKNPYDMDSIMGIENIPSDKKDALRHYVSKELGYVYEEELKKIEEARKARKEERKKAREKAEAEWAKLTPLEKGLEYTNAFFGGIGESFVSAYDDVTDGMALLFAYDDKEWYRGVERDLGAEYYNSLEIDSHAEWARRGANVAGDIGTFIAINSITGGRSAAGSLFRNSVMATTHGLMGVGASYENALASGATPFEARLIGTTNGLLDAGTSLFMFGKSEYGNPFIEDLLGSGTKAVVADIGISGGREYIEEGLTMIYDGNFDSDLAFQNAKRQAAAIVASSAVQKGAEIAHEKALNKMNDAAKKANDLQENADILRAENEANLVIIDAYKADVDADEVVADLTKRIESNNAKLAEINADITRNQNKYLKNFKTAIVTEGISDYYVGEDIENLTSQLLDPETYGI